MLLVNDVKYASLPDDHRFRIIYEEAFKQVKIQFGGTVVLDFPKEKYKKIPNPNNLGTRLEAPAGLVQPSYRVYATPKENFEVRYYETEKVGAGGKKRYNPAYLWFRGRTSIDVKTRFDYLFYLLFVSPNCEKIEGRLGDYQNINRAPNSQYVLFNEKAEAQMELATIRNVSEIQTMITSERLGLIPEKIYNLAAWYGLIDAVKRPHIDVVRKMLVNYVITKDSVGNYDYSRMEEFMNVIDLDDVIATRGLVKEAIEYGIVGLKKNGIKREWCYLTPEGEKRDYLCDGDWDVGHKNALVHHLIDHPNVKSDVYEMVMSKRSINQTKVEMDIDIPDDPEMFGEPEYEKKVERKKNKK